MGLNPIFTWAYGVATALFLTFELWALANKTPGDTITEHIQHYFRVKGKIGSLVFLVMFGSFSAWFAAHILGAI